MKKKTKIALAATTFMILSLTINTPRTIPQEHPQIPEVRPVSTLVNNTPAPPTQTATKPTTPPAPTSSEPKMGDTRIVNGKKQSYFLGFGWVDYIGEIEVVYCEGMYENGNKIGIMY